MDSLAAGFQGSWFRLFAVVRRKVPFASAPRLMWFVTVTVLAGEK